MQATRIKWVDVAKFIGIFSIYLGHLDQGASRNFVFLFHVPLFFLISGCMENFNKEENFLKYLLKKVKNILIPFFIFSILSIIINVLNSNAPFDSVKDMISLVLKGTIRNTFFAASLWFLSCLFVIEILFFIIKKVKIKSIILLLCLGLYIISNTIINLVPIVKPHLIYNVDSALYYIIYYAIGYSTFSYIQSFFELDSNKNKVLFVISGIISLVYSSLLFFGKDSLKLVKEVGIIPDNICTMFFPIIRTLIIIWLVFIVSKIFEDNKCLNKIGKETLYLCGSEYIVKVIFGCFVSILSLKLSLTSSLSCCIYSIIIILFAIKFLIPIEKEIISKFQNLFSKVFNYYK